MQTELRLVAVSFLDKEDYPVLINRGGDYWEVWHTPAKSDNKKLRLEGFKAYVLPKGGQEWKSTSTENS